MPVKYPRGGKRYNKPYTRRGKSGYKKRFVRPNTRKYSDGLNVKLVHTDMVIKNTELPAPLSYPYPMGQGSGLVTGMDDVITYMGTNTTSFSGAFLFRLKNALQWQQFNTLYDRVKINGVKLQFFPSYNTAVAGTAVPSQIPTMKYVYDFDDANPGYTADAIWARQGKVIRLNKPFSIYVKPKVRTSVQVVTQGSAPAVVTAKSERSGFLDVASAADVAHYGIKFAIRDWTVDAPLTLRVVATYYVTFRQMIWNGPTKALETLDPNDVIQDEEDTPCEEIEQPKP